MKNSSSNPFSEKSLIEKQQEVLDEIDNYFKKIYYQKLPSNLFNNYSPIEEFDKDRLRFKDIFLQMVKQQSYSPELLNLSLRESRGIASILGMAICDALGACTEFEEYNQKGYNYIKKGFSDISRLIKEKKIRARSGETTIWTDDASMGFAIAYSLLLKNYEFHPKYTRYLFHLWWSHGLGNGGRDYSIGLGGNISISMDEFMQKQTQYAATGDKNNSGNGSLMRLAPIPVAFFDDVNKAMNIAEQSSLTTHNGLEAKECCRLLTAIIVALINREDDGKEEKMEVGKDKQQNKEELPKWKRVIEEVCNQFKSNVKSVMCLATSKQEPQQLYKQEIKENKTFIRFNPQITDRNWNWKSKDFTYSKFRNNLQPGYIGSYCMDALAMALHTVWHTSSFKECAFKNTNMGGDCDSVGSIAGQIAGAVYGIEREMLELYSEMKDFTEKRFEAFLIGYKLINKKSHKGDKYQRKNINNESNKMQVEQ